MLNELTSVQLSEWEAYGRLDPIGEWRADFRMAYLCTIVTNIARKVHGEKGAKMAVPLDFIPEWGKEDEELIVQTKQTAEEMRQLMLAITKTQNGKTKKKKRTTPPKRKK